MTTTHESRIRIWPTIALLGVIDLVIGIAALAWPGPTLKVAVFLFGIQLLMLGVLRIVGSLSQVEAEGRWLSALVGILAVVAGLLVMREPLRSLEILVALLGIFWVIWGIIELLRSFAAEPGLRMATFFEGVFTVVVGGVLLAWPDITVRAFMLVLGIFLIAIALVQFYVAFRRREAEIRLSASMP